ncbi:MAG: GNAT family N-acetyltransferase [Ilumatobacteraceae bacterium]
MSPPRRATAAQVPRLCLTAMRAFADDPVMRWLYPDDAEFEADQGGVFRVPVLRWLAHGETWTTDDAVGLAAWVPPGRPEIDVDVGPPVDHPVWRLARFDALRGVMAANTPPERHWYLNLLATHPDWQRQGIGGALMAVTFERADRDGLACYLETETTANVAYYRHHGFHVRTEWDVPGDGPHMWGMLRPPRGA